VNVEAVLRYNQNLLHCAQRLGNYLGITVFEDFIRTAFGPLETASHPVVRTFATLPFHHVLTFNFEESIERAHAAAGLSFRSVSCALQADLASFLRNCHKAQRQIVHLHGKLGDGAGRIALTEDGYRGLYSREPLFAKLLWLLAATRSLVFVGFGFSDQDFCQAFRITARELQLPESCHFAIIGLSDEENDQERRNYFNDTFLVEPVFYNVNSNDGNPDHSEFLTLMNRIAAATGRQLERPRDAIAGGNPPQVGLDPEGLRVANQLADRLLQRFDPGGPDVQD